MPTAWLERPFLPFVSFTAAAAGTTMKARQGYSNTATLCIVAALATFLNLTYLKLGTGRCQDKSMIRSSSKSIDSVTPTASCTWSPSAPEECHAALVSRLCQNEPNKKASRRRFIAMGDSTTGAMHLFKYLYDSTIRDAQAKIQAAFGNEVIVEERRGGKCRNNELFGLGYPSAWVPPNFSLGEGPIHGDEEPFCSDCGGGESVFLIVANNASAISSNRKSFDGPLLYGGFFKSEFARDVTIQSPQFGTTQENTAFFIQKAYNSPDLLEEWRNMPVCLLSAAHHDTGVPGVTKEIYLTNVEWFIQVMQPQCHFIIWLGANLPAGQEGFPQTRELTAEWNTAVRQMLDNRPDVNAIFVDVLAASHYEGNLWPGDNLHMDQIWYETLGGFFANVLSTKC